MGLRVSYSVPRGSAQGLSNPFLDVHLLGEAADYLIGGTWHPLEESPLKGRATGLKGGGARPWFVFTDFPPSSVW